MPDDSNKLGSDGGRFACSICLCKKTVVPEQVVWIQHRCMLCENVHIPWVYEAVTVV